MCLDKENWAKTLYFASNLFTLQRGSLAGLNTSELPALCNPIFFTPRRRNTQYMGQHGVGQAGSHHSNMQQVELDGCKETAGAKTKWHLGRRQCSSVCTKHGCNERAATAARCRVWPETCAHTGTSASANQRGRRDANELCQWGKYRACVSN